MKAFRSKVPQENQEVATHFMLNEGRAHHNALTEIPPPDDLTSPALSDLQAALEAYNASVDKNRRINIQHCTFNDVLVELDSQATMYADKGKGPSNIARAGLRWAGDYSATISPWLDLIPSTMGLSFLNAGLRLVLSIAKQNADNREKIFNAFHDITHIILDTKARQDQFTFIQVLRKPAVALYAVLVKSLAELIHLLQGSKYEPQFKDHMKRLGHKLLNPASQSNAIDEILTAVQRSSAVFKNCLEMVNSQVSIETYQNTESLLFDTVSIKANAGVVVNIVEKIAGGVNELQDTIRVTHTKIDEVREELQALREQQYRRQDAAIHSQGAWMVFVLSDMPDPGVHIFLSPMQLFTGLNVSPPSLIHDVDFVLQHIGRIEGSAQTQAQQLLSSSETLYVQGSFRIASAGRISALSAVCATLSLNLSKNTDSIVLLFLCGLHEAGDDPIAGPNGLMRSFVAQLLLTGRDFNLDFINTRHFAEQIEAGYLPALTHTFRQLIEQLPTNATVVCIIDALVRFEYAPWLSDLSEVIFTLNQIIHNPALHPVVKLLATTPFTTSQHVGNLIHAHQVLTLRQTVVSGGHGIAERSIGERRDRLSEYRMAMERNGGSDDDSDGCYLNDSSDDEH
ncbi:hypothetical protein BJX99DRAFT_269323 [Aspergillus californicus]